MYEIDSFKSPDVDIVGKCIYSPGDRTLSIPYENETHVGVMILGNSGYGTVRQQDWKFPQKCPFNWIGIKNCEQIIHVTYEKGSINYIEYDVAKDRVPKVIRGGEVKVKSNEFPYDVLIVNNGFIVLMSIQGKLTLVKVIDDGTTETVDLGLPITFRSAKLIPYGNECIVWIYSYNEHKTKVEGITIFYSTLLPVNTYTLVDNGKKNKARIVKLGSEGQYCSDGKPIFFHHTNMDSLMAMNDCDRIRVVCV